MSNQADPAEAMSEFTIERLGAFSDNYIWLVNGAQGGCFVVDPADARPVREALSRLGWRLGHILITHHHPDHTGGVAELAAETGAKVVGAAADRARLPALDTAVADGDVVDVGGVRARVIATPGHTSGHVAYHFAEQGALFCGDTLFSLGCGRLFEGTADEMWASLRRLRALPDETDVFCAHEYTNANADFALSIEPENGALAARADEVVRLREAGRATVPVPLGLEKALNPFLRGDDPALQAALGMAGADPARVFAEVRRRKDVF